MDEKCVDSRATHGGGGRLSGTSYLIKARKFVAGLLAHAEGKTLAALILIGSLSAAFVSLSDEVVEGDTRVIDTRILLALRDRADPTNPLGPPWVEEIGRDLTSLGGVAVLAIVFVFSAGLLWLRGRRRTVGLVAVAVGGGLALSTLFKRGFDRPRPDLVPYGAEVYTASFPSGHSMMAAIVWLTLAALMARSEPRPAAKAWIMGVAGFVTVSVGLSRIYLGVHWPSDVLAGWTAGAAWALGCLVLARAMGRRGAIEPEAADHPDRVSDRESAPHEI